VKPVTPEDNRQRRSISPLLLLPGFPSVLTAVSVPPVTERPESTKRVFTVLFEFPGSFVWIIVVPV
jgi:hypothetical protein